MNLSKPDLLLHYCCGPCGPAITKKISQAYTVTAFWYNPNIYPQDEYDKRLAAFNSLCGSLGCKAVYGTGMNVEQFYAFQRSGCTESPERCAGCYAERLEVLGSKAKEMGISNISTTLLSSLYQKIDLIKKISEQVAEKYALTFVFDEFWHSYYESKREAKALGLYCQNYCGCYYSKLERSRQKNK
jgi:epoxyqueuosine reductase